MERETTIEEDAEARIVAVMQEVALMGANDYEMGTFQKILEYLRNGQITPEEALRQAFIIKNRKQDYH